MEAPAGAAPEAAAGGRGWEVPSLNDAHRMAYRFAVELCQEKWENAYQVKMEVLRLKPETWAMVPRVLATAKDRRMQGDTKWGPWSMTRLNKVIETNDLREEYLRVSAARERAKNERGRRNSR